MVGVVIVMQYECKNNNVIYIYIRKACYETDLMKIWWWAVVVAAVAALGYLIL